MKGDYILMNTTCPHRSKIINMTIEEFTQIIDLISLIFHKLQIIWFITVYDQIP